LEDTATDTSKNRAERRAQLAKVRGKANSHGGFTADDDASADKFPSIKLIRPDELCEALGIKRWTLNRWVAKGILPPPLRISEKLFMWRLVDVEAALVKRSRSRHQRKPRGALMHGKKLVRQAPHKRHPRDRVSHKEMADA
jgi:predicted DNA-binding transcriptional regulator AlpA